MYLARFQNAAGKRLKDRGREEHGGEWEGLPEPSACLSQLPGMARKQGPDTKGSLNPSLKG